MDMDDELETFLRERKVRVTKDKASLEQDPYYKTKPNRGYGSTVKENIPPKLLTQEDNVYTGLPLGLEYERKKKRLQHELRMDYRRDMAKRNHCDPTEAGPLLRLNNRRSAKQYLLEESAADVSHGTLPRRDAATLTEGSRRLHEDPSLAEEKPPCPAEYKSPVLPRHRERQGRSVYQEPEDERDARDELLLLEGSRGRHEGLEANYERTRFSDSHCREEKDIPSFAVENWISRPLTKNDAAGFATGLIIGTADTSEASQMRKERYRLELQEQMAEQEKNKRGGKKEMSGFARGDGRSRPVTKFEDADFATGFIFGTKDTGEVSKLKKERYRLELLEQIAEQHRKKTREKALELRIAANGPKNPEKQLDLNYRKDPQFVEPAATIRGPTNHERIIDGCREVPPPDQPHPAFQSPALDYSSAFPRAADTPRIPLLHPHPPATSGEVCRCPCADSHRYCLSHRNPPEPHMTYYGHLPAPCAYHPMSSYVAPRGRVAPSYLDDYRPQSRHSESGFLEPPPIRAETTPPGIDTCRQLPALAAEKMMRAAASRPSNDAATSGGHSGSGFFPPEKSRVTREGMQNYRDALQQQIQEKQEQKRLEREEAKHYEAQLEADMEKHQPWGRGGGGAPLRDSTGNLIADLNQMHKQNEEAYINPEQRQKKVTAVMAAPLAEEPDPNERVSGTVTVCSIPDSSDTPSGFTHVQTSQFARSNVFPNQPNQQRIQEQEKYRASLRKQIEEKQRQKADERERARLEDEKEERRLAEETTRMQREYEEEQDKKKKEELKKKARDDQLCRMYTQQREAAEKKKEEEEKRRSEQRKPYEMNTQVLMDKVQGEPLLLAPTPQRRHVQQETPISPIVESPPSPAPISERSLSGCRSPPVTACRNRLRASGAHSQTGDQQKSLSVLSALRQKLRAEQERLEAELRQSDWEDPDFPGDRHQKRLQNNVFDMARMRLPATVRRPNSRDKEPINLLKIHDSLQLSYPDADSRLEVLKPEDVGVARRRRERQDYKDPCQQHDNWKSTIQDDYFDLSHQHQINILKNGRRSTRGSLLESESTFIDPLGNVCPVPRTPERVRTPHLSARERRRLTKRQQRPQESEHTDRLGDYSDRLGSRLPQEDESSGDENCRDRMGRLTLSRGHTDGPVDFSDDDASLPHLSPYNRNHHSSVETIATDAWMRPGTSETLKCLERPLRRGQITT